LARVRLLLADDAGAGKTIMAGLLVRELKLRGLVDRVPVVCPANLTFQWQRELKGKFDEKFIVLKGGISGSNSASTSGSKTDRSSRRSISLTRNNSTWSAPGTMGPRHRQRSSPDVVVATCPQDRALLTRRAVAPLGS